MIITNIVASGDLHQSVDLDTLRSLDLNHDLCSPEKIQVRSITSGGIRSNLNYSLDFINNCSVTPSV